jgi:hypothetical protein
MPVEVGLGGPESADVWMSGAGLMSVCVVFPSGNTNDAFLFRSHCASSCTPYPSPRRSFAGNGLWLRRGGMAHPI